MTDAKHEAPAEGAGEAAIAKLFDAVEMADDYNRLSDRPKRLAKDFLLDSELRDAVSSLRARSSAPEAREEALGNLLAVIHGDGGHRALEVGTKQAALEAEKIVARLLSSAPESREVDQPFGYWVDHKAANSPVFIRFGSFVPASDHYTVTKLYTHPAAALSADKLRIAVEAIWEIAGGRATDGYNEAGRLERIKDRAAEALAALKAEGAK